MRSASSPETLVINGGSSTIYRRPSRFVVKRGSARSLVRDCARFAARLISPRNDISVVVSWSRATSSRWYERDSNGSLARKHTSWR